MSTGGSLRTPRFFCLPPKLLHAMAARSYNRVSDLEVRRAGVVPKQILWALLKSSERLEHAALGLGRQRVISLISLTHKRTEGRAPVWGSNFASKDPHYRGV
jgi:hypothetical protein